MGKEEGTAYLEEMVGGGETSFFQGHQAFRSGVVMLDPLRSTRKQQNCIIPLLYGEPLQ